MKSQSNYQKAPLAHLLKVLLVAFLAVFVCGLLSACGQGEELDSGISADSSSTTLLAQDSWGNYFENNKEGVLKWAQEFDVENVESVELAWYAEGGVVPHSYTDAETIILVFNALAALSLGENTDVVVEDNSYGIWFNMKDGTKVSFTFNDENADFGTNEIYTLENTAGLLKVFSYARDTDTAI